MMLSNRKKLGLGIALLTIASVILIFVFKNQKDTTVFRDLNTTAKSGRIRIVTDGSCIGFQAKDSKLTGFNYELAKALADSLELELEIIPNNDFDSCVSGLIDGRYDIIAMEIPTTTSLKLKLSFTTPIFNTRQVLVQQSYSGTTIHTTIFEPRYLSKDSICIPSDSPNKARLDNLSDEIANPIKIVEFKGKTTEELVKMVSEGKIKYTICDELQARKLQKKYPNIDINMPIGFNQPMAWAVSPKSKELLQNINNFMTDFLISSDYWEIYRRYF